jgi:hypothetical protein
VLVEQGEVELELAGEVLVEDGFGHACPFGDVIHGGGVVPRLDEGGLGCLEELGAAGRARHALAWLARGCVGVRFCAE